VTAFATGAATDPGYHYFHATLSDLQPSATYVYRLGDCNSAWSSDYDFATRDCGAFSFLFVGDPQMNGSAAANQGWPKTLDHAMANSPRVDFLVSGGDQVDSYTNALQSPQWDAFLAPKQMSSLALAPTVGNHDDASRTGTQYSEHLAVPNAGTLGATVPGSGDYWFTYNGALFMDLNTNNLDLAQHQSFLEATLAANPKATWRIVVFHQAPYSSADHPNDSDVTYLRQNLTPVLSQLGIDLVLNGHDHDYTRSYLMNGTTPEPGTGGSVLKPAKGDVLYIEANSASGGKYYPLTGPYPWAAVTNQEKVPNYTEVAVTGGHLTATTYRTSDGSVVDQVTLMK
jgi:calcineurin-like phosphoesterase family protein/purple acid phosphatase-like protein